MNCSRFLSTLACVWFVKKSPRFSPDKRYCETACKSSAISSSLVRPKATLLKMLELIKQWFLVSTHLTTTNILNLHHCFLAHEKLWIILELLTNLDKFRWLQVVIFNYVQSIVVFESISINYDQQSIILFNKKYLIWPMKFVFDSLVFFLVCVKETIFSRFARGIALDESETTVNRNLIKNEFPQKLQSKNATPNSQNKRKSQ